MFWRSPRVQKPRLTGGINALLLFSLCSVCVFATVAAAGDSGKWNQETMDLSYSLTPRDPASLSQAIDTSNLYASGETLSIQIITCVMGFLGLVGSSLVLYWFCRMRKQFRHQLIMVLIVGNILRSAWYFIFSIVAFAWDGLHTETAFCQAAGFFTQLGVELADFSVLFIAIHTALQVFKPRPLQLGQGGLYDYRYTVYALCAFLPVLLSGLVFVRGRDAYMYLGPICNLPLRPFWYRLGLSWIPRYAIMLTIICLYIAIYVHAKFVMAPPKTEGASQASPHHEHPRWSTFNMMSSSKKDRNAAEFKLPDLEAGRDHLHDLSAPCSPLGDPKSYTRRHSDGTTLVADQSTRGSSVNDNPYFPPISLTPETITPTPPAEHEPAESPEPKYTPILGLRLPRPNILQRLSSEVVDRQIETAEMRRRRNSIRKHLRLLFVYPIVYFAVWTLPFIMTALNYNTYYASHPPFALTLLSYLAVAGMGLIDSIIFALRERPWRHIPTADGTFYGSFKFWRKVENNRLSVVTSPTAFTTEDSNSNSNSNRFPQNPGVRISQLGPYLHDRSSGSGMDGTSAGVGNHDFGVAEPKPPERAENRESRSRDWFDRL